MPGTFGVKLSEAFARALDLTSIYPKGESGCLPQYQPYMVPCLMNCDRQNLPFYCQTDSSSLVERPQVELASDTAMPKQALNHDMISASR